MCFSAGITYSIRCPRHTQSSHFMDFLIGCIDTVNTCCQFHVDNIKRKSLVENDCLHEGEWWIFEVPSNRGRNCACLIDCSSCYLPDTFKPSYPSFRRVAQFVLRTWSLSVKTQILSAQLFIRISESNTRTLLSPGGFCPLDGPEGINWYSTFSHQLCEYACVMCIVPNVTSETLTHSLHG